MSIVDKIRNNPRFAAGGGVVSDAAPSATGEPWSGYDEQDVAAITAAVASGGAVTAGKVGAYERDHQARAEILVATDRHQGE